MGKVLISSAIRFHSPGGISIAIAGLLLSACSHPDMISQDGSSLQNFRSTRLTYARADGSETLCHFEEHRKLWTCDDGTMSDMTVAGIPLDGMVFADFDNKRFARK